MKKINWNEEKALLLKETRQIDFNELAAIIEEKNFFGVFSVPNRKEQKMFILDYNNYIICVPFVETEHEIFLKTAYRNRKLNKAQRRK
jgi:hypothetical protein